jgi:hypothetical protein
MNEKSLRKLFIFGRKSVATQELIDHSIRACRVMMEVEVMAAIGLQERGEFCILPDGMPWLFEIFSTLAVADGSGRSRHPYRATPHW